MRYAELLRLRSASIPSGFREKENKTFMDYSIAQWITDDRPLTELASSLSSLALALVMVFSLLLLCKGADYMIDGVVAIARRTRIPQIVIGATIISLGTTFPEMLVSTVAAWRGDAGLALGNGVGSIICDTGMIFGIMCIFKRIPVERYTLNRHGWVQVGSATFLALVSFFLLISGNGAAVISRGIGFFLLFLLVCYLYASYHWGKKGLLTEQFSAEPIPDILKSVLFLVGGLLTVGIGSKVLVPCAAEGAIRLGVPTEVIAATMVAFGTSLPELMTAVSSIRKGHPEIMVGNIVGADILNCLFVIGAAAVASPLRVPRGFFILHYPVMLFILYSFRAFIFMDKDGYFKRWQGVWIFGVYLVYILLQYVFGVGA